MNENTAAAIVVFCLLAVALGGFVYWAASFEPAGLSKARERARERAVKLERR